MAPSTNGWEDTREDEREALDEWEQKTVTAPKVQPVGELQPGTRFQIAALPDRTGTVVRIGTGSALVRYAGKTHCHIESKRTGECVDFDRPKEPVTISLGTLVIAL